VDQDRPDPAGRLLPIKATNRPRLRDAAHLRTFRSEYGGSARAGILLHTGTALEWVSPVCSPPLGGGYAESA